MLKWHKIKSGIYLYPQKYNFPFFTYYLQFEVHLLCSCIKSPHQSHTDTCMSVERHSKRLRTETTEKQLGMCVRVIKNIWMCMNYTSCLDVGCIYTAASRLADRERFQMTLKLNVTQWKAVWTVFDLSVLTLSLHNTVWCFAATMDQLNIVWLTDTWRKLPTG